MDLLAIGILRRLLHRVWPSTEIGQGDSTAALLRRVLEPCPKCKCSFNRHTYALLGSLIANDSASLSQFFDAAKRGDWDQIARSHEFDPKADVVEAYVIQCHEGNFVAFVIDAFELGEERLLAWESLSNASMTELERLIPQEKWRPLDR